MVSNILNSQFKLIQMLSNTKCKKILNKNGIHYTDEEIVLIKNVLYKMAEIFWKNEKLIKASVNKQIQIKEIV